VRVEDLVGKKRQKKVGASCKMDLCNLWAKTPTDKEPFQPFQPLILHLIDTAIVVEELLRRESPTTKAFLTNVIDLPWLLVLSACHDLGKCSMGFELQWSDRPASGLPYNPSAKWVSHGWVSQIALVELLQKAGWSPEVAKLAADAVGSHHGIRASLLETQNLKNNRHVQHPEWVKARQYLFDSIVKTFNPGEPPSGGLEGGEFVALAGIISQCDWIASDPVQFPAGTPADCTDLDKWVQVRRPLAKEALDKAGFQNWQILTKRETFQKMFKLEPRPLQTTVLDIVQDLDKPSVMLVEAPCGEGKTEAAFWAASVFEQKFKHRGFYVALPTQATGSSMFHRALRFIRSQRPNQPIDFQLVHTEKYLDPLFAKLRHSDAVVHSGSWLAGPKRPLLSRYGVGTIDQALLSVLPVRHNFIRAWGLSNKTVIFDEIHAYDDYTGTLLIRTIQWLLSVGSSVILLSATLHPSFRKRLGNAIGSLNLETALYPRVSLYQPGCISQQFSFEPDRKRDLQVQIKGISHTTTAIKDVLDTQKGYRLALVNTVRRAQILYESYGPGKKITYGRRRFLVGKTLSDGTRVFLFHSRFPADNKKARESKILKVFGKQGLKKRNGKCILIATQVAEQSLDIDFDVIVSDLAPIDLILQRMGRLWRWLLDSRPVPEPVFYVAGLAGSIPHSFGSKHDLYWDLMYRGDLLLLTWLSLKDKTVVQLPDDTDKLVHDVYEGQVTVPDTLQERFNKAKESTPTDYINDAELSVIGHPGDHTWEDVTTYPQYATEDQADPSVTANTRIGSPSITVIPIYNGELRTDLEPDNKTGFFFLRKQIKISQNRVIKQIGTTPEAWKKSIPLRRCIPFELDNNGRWLIDPSVLLDNELGLVYEDTD